MRNILIRLVASMVAFGVTGWLSAWAETYEKSDDANTSFSDSFTYDGTFTTNGTLTLESAANTLGALVGNGAVTLTAADGTLTVGSNATGHDGYYFGSLSAANGNLTLVKTGTNTQTFATALDFNGSVVVEAGTLRLGKLGNIVPNVSVAPDLYMDATDTASITKDAATGKVSSWANKGAAGANADLLQDVDVLKPIYDSTEFNGRGGVVFQGSTTSVSPTITNRLCLAAGKSVKLGMLYMVFATRQNNQWAGLIGGLDTDNGIRTSASGNTYSFEENYIRNWFSLPIENCSVNGMQGVNSFSVGTVYAFGGKFNTVSARRISVGQYYPAKATESPRAFNGAMGEVLVYSNELAGVENYLVTKYLMNKWGVEEDAAATANVLPAGSSLTVKQGAVLEFAGVNQEFDRLENYGTIRNTSATPVVLTVKRGVLHGKIEGNVRVVFKDGSVALKSWRTLHDLPVTENLSFHLDGADLASLMLNDQGQVTNWVDQTVNGVDFKEDRDALSGLKMEEGGVSIMLPPPKFDCTAFEGRGGVKFEANATRADGGNRLSSGDEKKCDLRSVFFVTHVGGNVGFSGLFGIRNSDDGLRVESSTSWQAYSSFDKTLSYVNGNRVLNNNGHVTFASGQAHVFQAGTSALQNRVWSLGQYYCERSRPTMQIRGFIGSVAEVIAYDTLIEGEAQEKITKYLTDKWLSKNMNLDEAILGENVQIVLDGSTLDLGGTTQTLNGLYGSGGTIANGSVTVTGVLEVTPNANGIVAPYRLENATLGKGLRIKVNGTPSGTSLLVATGVREADVSSFTVEDSRGWRVSLSQNGDLKLSCGGFMFIVR